MKIQHIVQTMAECDCQHAGCATRKYCMAAEIERLRRKLAKAVDALGMGLDADNDAHPTGPTQ